MYRLVALTVLSVSAVTTGILVHHTASIVPLAPIIKTIDHRRYAFNYAVNDPHTGDKKAQWEEKNGGVVKGSYSLVEPDGSVRVVQYTADDIKGFNAVVKNIGANAHPTPLVAKAPARLAPIIGPINYGFSSPIVVDTPKATSVGHWSLPWDPITHSYGGWVPIGPHGPVTSSGPYATVVNKKYVDGKLYKWVSRPIPLSGKTWVIKKTYRSS